MVRQSMRQGLWGLLLGAMTLTTAVKVAAAQGAVASIPLPLKVVKTQVLDSKGHPVPLRGVNTASMEWTSNGDGHILETVRRAIEDWHVNIVRLPLAQDRWFGKAPEQTDNGVAYQELVRKVVDLCAAHGCYILLDLHWSDAGEWGKQIGQHVMPDENSVTFWTNVATVYKNQPAVLFDLYNEPHDVSWTLWRDGGTVTERDRKNGDRTYQAVGMQKLLDTVRATGAQNVVVAGGLDWAYDLSGILVQPLSDPKGNGVIYANHAYPFKGESVTTWIKRMETATAQLPVIVSEFGSDPKGGAGETGEQWVQDVLKALHDHNWNWTAWDLHPAAGPTLISDWDFTPTPQFGVFVKQALLSAQPK
jgi:endoglucanase